MLMFCLLLSLTLLTQSTTASATLESFLVSQQQFPQSETLIYIAITKDGFEPELTTIAPKTTVIWTNYLTDPVTLNSAWVHSVYIPFIAGGGFNEKDNLNPETVKIQDSVVQPHHRNWFAPLLLDPGESFTYTFNEVGDYPVQADMDGKVSGMIKVAVNVPSQPASTPIAPTPIATTIPTTANTVTPTIPSNTTNPTATATATPPNPTDATSTPTPRPSSTPTVVQTPNTLTPTPTPTKTPVTTVTPTKTPQPSETPTSTATPSSTPTPTAEIQEELKVSLFTDPADGTNITFKLNGDHEFILDSDEIETNDNDSFNQVATFTDLGTGNHTVSLIEPSNFILSELTCSSDQADESISITAGDVAFTLRTGEKIHCEYRMLKDSDFDRLADIYETDTQNYVSATNTGTDPYNRDTDSDGLLDGDEVLGTIHGLNLPGMGANPLRKTVLVEYDWVEDNVKNNGYCGEAGVFHSHRPSSVMMNNAAAVYANAPISNPDGSNGVDLIQDYGQGGLFTGGTMLFKNGTGLIVGTVDDEMFINLKNANFDENRKGYFHYAIFAHQYISAGNFSSGQAEIGGDDIIVSIYNYYCSDALGSFAAVHELGHNMGLRHGGHDNLNNKPNYNSVMNYKFQFAGKDSNESCDGQGDGINGYSTGWRIDLNELDLDESEGVCGPNSTPIDWNENTSNADHDVVHDINNDGSFNVLQDHDDWGNLYFLGPLHDADIRGPRAALFREVELSEEPVIPGSPLDTEKIDADAN